MALAGIHSVDCRPAGVVGFRAVSTYDWLLLFHIVGAFLLFSGSVVAGLLHLAAIRRERPSEIALLLGLVRPAVPLILIGALLTLALGLWLTDEAGYSYGDGWIVAALVLWLAGNVLGFAGGKPLGEAGSLAARLAADGDQPSDELNRAVTDARTLFLNYASLASVVAVLVLMVWKPGA
jgi:uncharacterized membrane protein